MAHYLKTFNTLGDFSKYLENSNTTDFFLNGRGEKYLSSNADTPKAKKFTSTESFEEADELMKYGDKKNAAKLNKAIKVNAPAFGVANKKRPFNAVWGFIPNVGAALAGDPLNMIMMQNVPMNKKVITIIFDRSVDHTIKTNEIVDTSARLINAIIALESAGKRVNLYIANGFANTGYESADESLIILTKIKDSGSIFDKAKMAYSLINASYHRRHSFKALEVQEGLHSSKFTDCYGYPPNKKLTAKILKEKHFDYDALFTFYDIRYKDDNGIKTLIESNEDKKVI